MGWDASTSAAVAALIVAGFALLITSAQVLQQYYITGQLIRICDSVVFGPLPGRGRRVWQMSQFRFRVIYSIPQISLDPDLWPTGPPHTRSYAIGKHELPPLGRPDGAHAESSGNPDDMSSLYAPNRRKKHGLRFSLVIGNDISVSSKSRSSHRQVGEAAWVSFCRAVEEQSGDSMRFDLVEQDADRCPPDLISAPMHVSMRDIVVMGLMTGMEVISCSFDKKSVSMQGHVGTLTSSSHPVLGPMLHFTPRNNEKLFFGAFGVRRHSYRGKIESRWLARTWDVCIVAQKYFRWTVRRTARRLDDRWLRDQSGNSYNEVSLVHEGKRPHRLAKDFQGDANADGNDGLKAISYEYDSETPMKRAQDGEWEIIMPPEREKVEASRDEQARLRGDRTPSPDRAPEVAMPEAELQQEVRSPGGYRHATVEDAEESHGNGLLRRSRSTILEERTPSITSEMKERLDIARSRQATRSARVQEIESDRRMVEESVKRGAITTNRPSQLLLTWHSHHPDLQDDDQETREVPKPTAAEEEARNREDERQRLRKHRDDERVERNNARNRAVYLTKVDFFWFSQMNIFQGFWATPWHENDQVPIQSSLVGAVTVILEALLGFLDHNSLIYTNDRFSSLLSYQDTARWMFRGKTTYPAYALNARGGVIAEGVYRGVRIPSLKTVIPAVELSFSYEWQVSPELHDPVRYCEEQNVELMRLDSWLSYVGRTREISHGRNKLLKQTPALTALLMEDFEIDFQNIDLSATEGGLQDIQGLAANIMDFLADEGLSDAEQLYLLIAFLRTVKVCQCVLAGPRTAGMRDILLQDVQVHLV